MSQRVSSGWRSTFFAVVVLGLSGVAASRALAQASDLLPDIIIDVNQLYDNQIVTSGGRTLLRLSNGTPNIGAGKLYLYGGASNGDGTQKVIQRIYRTDGTFWERTAGNFIYHPTHNHIHFEAWCQYRLRERIGEDGLGAVVAQGEKTSFCILDLAPYDPTLPGYNPSGEFRSCGTTTQGLSVGWMDIYSKDLDGQDIDITGVPDGNYWLESEADPDNHVLESHDDNNVTRIKVVIQDGSTLPPDRYEPNDTFAQVDARQVGAVNSPNLGPTGPMTVIPGLSMHKRLNFDYYKLYLAGPGTASDFVRIDFTSAVGNLSLHLYNSAHTVVRSSSSQNNNYEQFNLSGLASGWYYVRVAGAVGATNPDYTLTINPSSNAAPNIVVTDPPAGDIKLVHGADAYVVKWTASDPNSDPTWVTLWLNTSPAFDGHEILIPTSLNTPGNLGLHTVNSTYVPPGTYWVYAQATDGGTPVGSWSPGTVTFEEHICVVDFNNDGFVNGEDFDEFVAAFQSGADNADVNEDEFVNGDDFDYFADQFELGC